MRIILLFFTSLLLPVFVSPSLAGTREKWSGTGQIEFSGTSTLHDWAGKVKAEPFRVTVTKNDQGQPESISATVKVTAAKMDTAEPKRDENMRNDMRVTDFPFITGAFDTPFRLKDGKPPSTVPFTLTLLGKPHKVDASLSAWSLKGDAASFDLDFDLSLKTCGINVPSVLLVVRVADKVHVHVAAKLARN